METVHTMGYSTNSFRKWNAPIYSHEGRKYIRNIQIIQIIYCHNWVRWQISISIYITMSTSKCLRIIIAWTILKYIQCQQVVHCSDGIRREKKLSRHFPSPAMAHILSENWSEGDNTGPRATNGRKFRFQRNTFIKLIVLIVSQRLNWKSKSKVTCIKKTFGLLIRSDTLKIGRFDVRASMFNFFFLIRHCV